MSPVTFNFILNCPDSELKQYEDVDLENDQGIFSRFDLEWNLQTYLHLKNAGNLSVVYSNQMMPDAVNVVHSSQLIENIKTSNCFIVSIQADFSHRIWRHYHIVQNQNQQYDDSSVVPLWIQPGLIKRDFSRQGVKNVAYAGQIYNGNLAGTKEMWTNLFNPYGIEFVTLPSGACNDLHDIDVLIGIRSFTTSTYDKKPPSKLVNAWHAGIPFIGGYDSAFRQIAVPGEDYLLAKSADEVLQAVLRLRDDNVLYSTLVKNGQRKALRFTQQTITQAWEEILSGPVLLRYEKWKSRLSYEKARYVFLLGCGLLIQQVKNMARAVLRR